MKYAIIESGGKQFRVSEGDVIQVDRLPEEKGLQVTYENILLLSNDDNVKVGNPLLKGVKVTATVLEHLKGKKIIVFKYRPKQRYRVKSGHRQNYTRLTIDSIHTE